MNRWWESLKYYSYTYIPKGALCVLGVHYNSGVPQLKHRAFEVKAHMFGRINFGHIHALYLQFINNTNVRNTELYKSYFTCSLMLGDFCDCYTSMKTSKSARFVIWDHSEYV